MPETLQSVGGVSFQWVAAPTPTQLPLRNGVANISYTALMPCADADQLSIICTPNYADGFNILFRVDWSGDNPGNTPRAGNDTFVTVSQSGGVNTIRPWINEYMAQADPAVSPVFTIPVLAHFFRVGVYQNGAVTASTLQLDIERFRSVFTQQP